MDNEKKLSDEFKTYQDLAAKNKNIDVASLMMSALENQSRNLVSPKQRHIAYMVSVGVPPLGLLFALKLYFFSNEDDARHVANICIVLTILSILAMWLITKVMFSSAGVSNNQINQLQNLNVNDVKNLLQ